MVNTDLATLARQILHHSRRRLTHIVPLLLECIYALPERERETPGPLSTDGRTLWYCPAQVVEDFRADRDAVARQLLHVTLHCLLGHLELRSAFAETSMFDRAADLKAAEFAAGLCGEALATRDGKANSMLRSYSPLRPLYQTLQEDQPYNLKETAKQVRLDDHRLWNPSATQASPGETVPTPNPGELASSQTPDWNLIRQALLDGSQGKLPGNCAGMLEELMTPTEGVLSYADFLKRFAAPQERMLLDPDSFDPRWYHLGLETYGNIPLLEPSELSESPMPDDIVIALDTSGSCSGEVCKRFLRETLGILRDISAGATRFRVLLLQCDTTIQQELLLETPEQIEAMFQSFTVRGFGGTDFRPVFQRVEQLRQDGILPRIRGLLYLTDSYGIFPDKAPPYPTAFLIPEEDRRHLPSIPSWITRLLLQESDYTVEEAL